MAAATREPTVISLARSKSLFGSAHGNGVRFLGCEFLQVLQSRGEVRLFCDRLLIRLLGGNIVALISFQRPQIVPYHGDRDGRSQLLKKLAAFIVLVGFGEVYRATE